MNRKVSSTFALFLVIVMAGCGTGTSGKKGLFHGMYALDKYETYDSTSGEWKPLEEREGASGYILYDGLGHMGVHLVPKGYKDFDLSRNIDSLSTEELKARLKFYQSNFVYMADYEVTDTTIQHKRLSTTSPKDWGTVLTRNYAFHGDTLILTAHEKIDNKKVRLRWIRKP
jgi:hypothetical protein